MSFDVVQQYSKQDGGKNTTPLRGGKDTRQPSWCKNTSSKAGAEILHIKAGENTTANVVQKYYKPGGGRNTTPLRGGEDIRPLMSPWEPLRVHLGSVLKFVEPLISTWETLQVRLGPGLEVCGARNTTPKAGTEILHPRRGQKYYTHSVAKIR